MKVDFEEMRQERTTRAAARPVHSPDVQRSLLRRSQQRAGHLLRYLLLQVVDLRLEPIVVLRFELRDDRHRLSGTLQRLCRLLVRRRAQVDAVHAEDLVAATELAAEVGRSAGEDERYEYALAIFAADDVEPEPARSLVQHDRPHFPATEN